MFNIAICDDEPVFTEQLDRQIRAILDRNNAQYGIDCFEDASVLENAASLAKYNLIFLDIMMRHSNGLDVAIKLRSQGCETDIIFVTSHDEYALEAYSTYPVTYLKKPVLQDELERALMKCVNKRISDLRITVTDKRVGRISISVNDIMYLESQRHDIIIYTVDRKAYTITGSFDEFRHRLPSDIFFHCHRCYSVNMHYTHGIRCYFFTLTDGTDVPIARPNYKNAQLIFAKS